MSQGIFSAQAKSQCRVTKNPDVLLGDCAGSPGWSRRLPQHGYLLPPVSGDAIDHETWRRPTPLEFITLAPCRLQLRVSSKWAA